MTNNICHICGRDIVSPVAPVCDCAEELESLRSANQAMTETAAENSLVHVEMHNRIHDLNQAVMFHAEDADIHRNRSIELTDALNKVWDALTAEDKRGALTDTLWMPGENCTVFEFIDHTLNPK